VLNRWIHQARRAIAPLLVATAALVALPAIASAEGGGMPVVGLEVKAVDPGARTVNAVLHCVPPEKAGRAVTLGVGEGVDLGRLAPGQFVGAVVNLAGGPPTIVELKDMPCSPAEPRPGGQPGKPGKPMQPGQPGEPGDDEGEPDEREDGFKPGFLSRVWKFAAEVDGYEAGELSVTIDKVLNLPKRWRDQDDDLIDEDATVLVGKARVYDEDGKRTSRGALEDAEDVKVHGKLLPPDRWEEAEDGEPVPTIRAKKVYIVG
jgi:hypothetical protein